MMRANLLAAVLLFSPALGLAADLGKGVMVTGSAAVSGLQVLDQEIRDMLTDFRKTEDCFAFEKSLVDDLDAKRASLSAEYKGKIPAEFSNVLWRKTERINKQHPACILQYEDLGKKLVTLQAHLRNIEPKSLNVKRQKAIIDAQNVKYRGMQPSATPLAPKTRPRKN